MHLWPQYPPGGVHAFFDDFNGSSLGPAWTVIHPNTSEYSVSGGFLHTKTLTGDLWGGANNYSNLFVIANPFGAGDFVATMKVNNFSPSSNWQQIDIVAYDDDGNHVRCINGYVFGGRHWEFVFEVGGVGNNSSQGAGHVATNANVSDFWLRLVKQGNTYQQFYSLDGLTYTQANGTITYGDGSPTYLGILALQGSGYYQTPATVAIDYFQAVPVPEAHVLLGSGLLGLIGLRGWRRRR